MGIIKRDRFVMGDYNAISDLSGQKFKRSDMKITWNGLLVGAAEFEKKHPQLTIRPPADRPAITDQTRTQPEDPPLEGPTFDPSGGV